MFGYTIVRKEYLKELEKKGRQIQTVHNVFRWFSGWKDLDIIWDYVFAETYYGDISSCREKYAKARGTDAYGASLGHAKKGDL